MRSFIYLIVIAAAAYVGYSYYTTGSFPVKIGAGASSSSAETASDESAPAPSAPTAPGFQSKIPLYAGPPGEKHLAKPGIFYVLEREKIEHATGVAAVVPGEEVELMGRKGSVMKVRSTLSKYEFEMKESQLTNDLDVAREVERKYVLTHPPARR